MSATTIAPEAPPTTVTLTLPAREALYLARVGASAASTDWVTPVITGARLSAEDGVVTVVATDRYRVHRARVSVEGGSLPGVILPRTVLDWVIANATFFKRAAEPVVTFDLGLTASKASFPGGSVTVTVRQSEGVTSDSVSFKTALTEGNYPPVERLITAALEAPHVASDEFVNLGFLHKARSIGVGDEMPRMRSVATSSIAGKAGQALVIYQRGEALIQKSAGAY